MESVDIPARLRALRLKAGISQRTAARAAGVTSGTWSRWERGDSHPQLKRATRITQALDAPICALRDHNGLTPIADLYITPATLEQIRHGGYPAAQAAAQELAHALTPRLHAAAHEAVDRTHPDEAGHPLPAPRMRGQAAKARIEAKQQARNQAARLRSDALASEPGGEGPNG